MSGADGNPIVPVDVVQGIVQQFPRGMGSSTGDCNRGQWTRKSPAAR